MDVQALLARINKLRPDQQQEVLDFAEFLEQKNRKGEDQSKGRGKGKSETAYTQQKTLKAGFLKGTFTVKEGFDEPLDDFKEYM